ncbi:MAG: hypothetical protein JNK82_38600 [Myxococcaceae bacterium]|nr:hypothetical protein [Myxococcaceae bacterium]
MKGLGGFLIGALLDTQSLVPAANLGDLVGKKVIRPMEPGDAFMWQLLDSAVQPQSERSCEHAVDRAVHTAREQAAKVEVERP